jgi:hypothetical protein
MHKITLQILIRPSYATLCEEFEHDPTDNCDPDKLDPIAFEQGLRTEPRLVEPGDAFEIARGWEGCLGESQAEGHQVQFVDPKASLMDAPLADWGLLPGRYLYDGQTVTLQKRFAVED